MSSNGCLQGVRRIFQARKAGHTGTLDPLASGVLVICFGEATKFSSWALESPKRYVGRIRLGVRTATGDAEGEVVESSPVPCLPRDLGEVARRFTGRIVQRPPVYSALKYQGRPLYSYARAGEDVPIREREITISALSLDVQDPETLAFDVQCSSGTYVRSLAEDVAAALGTVGHLASLRRTASGSFDLSDCVSPEILEALTPEELEARPRSPDCLPYRLPRLTLAPDEARALQHGQVVPSRGMCPEPGQHRVYSPELRFLGVAEADVQGQLRVVRMMSARDAPSASLESA
ncbi:MAG: tRNA pseudouridine(55) synthase TruB [Betaproteobacteria bacterium]|nr:tRNA pseudouridine(55) synthase TruB [Betaproteobacteria bacterium]